MKLPQLDDPDFIYVVHDGLGEQSVSVIHRLALPHHAAGGWREADPDEFLTDADRVTDDGDDAGSEPAGDAAPGGKTKTKTGQSRSGDGDSGGNAGNGE